ncbi:hypothetical protein BDF22DRAFT_699554 [Syncephalis plumigaleata]|nr:hypothetical protein BDF22DRAFT_699554 [Syncephalis plumigaleata]
MSRMISDKNDTKTSQDLLNIGSSSSSLAQRLNISTTINDKDNAHIHDSDDDDNNNDDDSDVEMASPPSMTKPNITRISAPNDLLSKVAAFLPQMEQANQVLLHQVEADPQQFDIEAVSDDEEYIEMNLGLGVLEKKHADAEENIPEICLPGTSSNTNTTTSPPQIIMVSENESSDDSDDDSDDDSE